MNQVINTDYPPRRFICVLSASYPVERLNFNDQAKAIRAEVDKRYNVKRKK